MNKKIYKYKTFWLLLLVTGYLLFGFFYAPKLINKHLKLQLQEQLGMQAELSAVKFNPMTFTTELSDLTLTDSQQQTWFQSQSTGINFDPFNLIWGEWKFSDLNLKQPNITLLTNQAGQVIVPALPEFPESTNSDQNINLSVDNIQLTQGRMNLQAGNIKKDFALNIKSIEISHDKISLADEDTFFDIKITTEHDESIELSGHYNHIQQLIKSQITLSDWQSTTLNQVLPDDLMINNQSGTLQANGHIEWPLTNKPIINFERVKIVNLVSQWQQSVKLTDFTAVLSDVLIDTENQQIDVTSFSSDQAQWQLNWPLTIGPVEDQQLSSEVVADETKPTEKPWEVNVQSIDITQWPIEITDQTIDAILPLTIKTLNIDDMNNVTQPIQLSSQIQLDQQGLINFSSEQVLEPFKLSGDLSISALNLTTVSPWITNHSGLVFTQGHINTDQNITIENNAFTLYGGLTVVDSIIQNTKGQDIADFGMLDIAATQINSADKTITVDQISIDRANGNILIDGEKNINIQNLKSAAENQEDESVNSKDIDDKAWLIKVGAINIKDTSTALIDQSVKPEVKTSISELNGHIKGLSSETLSKADVDINGKFNQFSPLSIQGQINPLSSDAYTDLKITVEDLDLLAFSPYAASYVAFPINGGKLNIELEYSLNQHELIGKNNLLFKQFKLGDKSPSPDAIDLPLKLAVTLLSDMNGEMKINLPVSGNLTDPEFSYGGLVGKAIFKLITSIVASPFKILGALIPNPDPNLSDIHFSSGSAELLPSEQNKLNQIAEILAKKPALNLQLNPQIDNAYDLTGIQQAMLLSQTPFSQFDPADTLVTDWLTAQLSAEEVLTYQKEDGSIDAQKVWQDLIQKQVVEPADFNVLTEQRTLGIKTYLLESAGISAEKIFIEKAQSDENNQSMIKIGVSR